MGVDALAALRLFAVAQLLQVLGEALLDFFLVAEDAVIDGDEAMADAGAAVLGLVDALSSQAAAHDAAEQLTDHAQMYSLLSIGGEHMAKYEKMCADRGLTIEQVKGILKPYWEKMGCPVVQLESVTEPASEETPEEKAARQARLHSIRTYFFRKDCKLTQKRIDKMKDLIAEVRGYGYPTEEYEAVLAASIKELEPKE